MTNPKIVSGEPILLPELKYCVAYGGLNLLYVLCLQLTETWIVPTQSSATDLRRQLVPSCNFYEVILNSSSM